MKEYAETIQGCAR